MKANNNKIAYRAVENCQINRSIYSTNNNVIALNNNIYNLFVCDCSIDYSPKIKNHFGSFKREIIEIHSCDIIIKPYNFNNIITDDISEPSDNVNSNSSSKRSGKIRLVKIENPVLNNCYFDHNERKPMFSLSVEINNCSIIDDDECIVFDKYSRAVIRYCKIFIIPKKSDKPKRGYEFSFDDNNENSDGESGGFGLKISIDEPEK